MHILLFLAKQSVISQLLNECLEIKMFFSCLTEINEKKRTQVFTILVAKQSHTCTSRNLSWEFRQLKTI